MSRQKSKRLGPLAKWIYRWSHPVPKNASRVNNAVLSLTSYGPRLNDVDLTIRSLFHQSVLPALIVLYVSESERSRVPSRLANLQNDLFQIRYVPDWKSYKKFIPALRWLHSREADFRWLIVCDDDTIYPSDWFAAFKLESRGEAEAVAHRCHVVSYDAQGNLLPYRYWKMNVKNPPPEVELFPTGCGGIALPVRAIRDYFYLTEDWRELAPTCDDVWIYFMLKISGVELKQSGYTFMPLEWLPRGSEKLWKINREVGEASLSSNDIAMKRCENRLRDRGLAPSSS